MMLSFISEVKFLKILQEFIENILKENNSKAYLTNISSANNYFITFEKIENVMNAINQKDYDLFLDAKKYNL